MEFTKDDIQAEVQGDVIPSSKEAVGEVAETTNDANSEEKKKKKTTVVMKNGTAFPMNNIDALSADMCITCDPEAEKDKAPVDRIVLPSDIAEFHEDDDSVYIIGTRDGKVTQIAGLEKMHQIKVTKS